VFDSSFQFAALLAPDGRLLEVNRAALEFCGCPAEALLGRPLWQVVVGGAEVAVALRVRKHVVRAAAGELVHQELELRGNDGHSSVVDFSLKPVRDEAGRVTMLVAEGRDISEHVRLQAQLAQAQKMEAVGQLTGGIAHDFNNLLQAVVGNLDLIHRLAEEREDARLLRLATNAERAAARGGRLTQQLLAFSRRQALRPELVWVNQVIADTGELLTRAAGATVALRTYCVPELWPCYVDPAQFESALVNLAINARDAMPHGGSLTIGVSNLTLSPAAAAPLEVVAGDYVRVDVADTGTGIAPEHLPHLFEPFFTTKPVGKGSGLGLPMVHGFARQSGGAVTVASVFGAGTTVSLFLPRELSAAVRPAVGTGQAGRPVARDTRRLTVLLVEDDVEALDAVHDALIDAGHRVMAARDGAEALLLLAGGHLIDLLLCDVGLPGGMNGIEVARQARLRCPDLRVLLTSGHGADVLTDAGVARDRYEVLAKPFSLGELLSRIAAQDGDGSADELRPAEVEG
jgi:PAS domain S-box-containing protein